MATYRTAVKSPMAPADAFAYMSDLRNFAEWDPGVTRVVQVTGDGGGPDTAFDVTVKGLGGDLDLRYITLDHQPPTRGKTAGPGRVLVRADTRFLSSVDEVLVLPDGTGSIVTYDAELALKGVARVFGLGLGLVFDRIGDRAAAGMERVLDGEVVPMPDAALTDAR